MDLDVAGGQVGVAPLAAIADHAAQADAEFRAQLAGQGVRTGIGLRLEHDLRDAGAVAQIDEHAAAVIAPRRHPAEKHDGGADVSASQCAAVMGTLQILEKLRHVRFLLEARPGVDILPNDLAH